MAASDLNLSGEEIYSDGDGDNRHDTDEASPSANCLKRDPFLRNPDKHPTETSYLHQRRLATTVDGPIPIPRARSRNKDTHRNSPTPQPSRQPIPFALPQNSSTLTNSNGHEQTSHSSEKLIVTHSEKTRIEHSTGPLIPYAMIVALVGVILLQTFLIWHISAENSHRFDLLEFEHRAMTSELFQSIADIKSVIQEQLKLFRNQNSNELQEVRQCIKKLYTRNSQLADAYSINPSSHHIGMEEPKVKTNYIFRNKASQFRKSLEDLKNDLHMQFEETWIELFSGIVSIMDETDRPGAPGALMFLVPPSVDYELFAACFAKKLANIVNSAHGLENAPLKEITREYLESFPTLTDIHDDLKKYLTDIGKTVIVYEPDQITREDHLMIFHSFCDNFMAYEKSATFFFLMKIPKDIVQAEGWRVSSGRKITGQFLHRAWENVMSYEKRAALIARIAVNIVSLRNGDSCN